MPIKWPWSRSRPTAEEQPSAPAGPAAPVDPGWRAVPPVQRTIGAMELTAPPRSFTESLATAQDPALISENRPGLLTTGSPVSVLRTVQQPDSVAAQPTSSPAPHSSSPAPYSSRQWMPPLNVQRASLGAATTSPPPTLPLMSSDAIEPYVDSEISAGSLVHAADPDEPRVVSVVEHVEPIRPMPVSTERPRENVVQRAVAPDATAASARPTVEWAVQPAVEPGGGAPLVSAVQRSVADDAAPPASATPAAVDALRTVSVVDFSPPAGAPLPAISEATLPTTPPTDLVAPPAAESHSAPASATSSPVGAQPLTTAVQRTAVDAVAAPEATGAPQAASVVEFSPPGDAPLRAISEATLATTSPTDLVAPPAAESHSAPASATSRPVGAQPLTTAVQRTAVDAVAAPEATDAPRTASVLEFNRPESPSVHTDSGATMAAVRDDAVVATPPPSLPVTTASPSITAVTTSALPLASAVQRSAVRDGGGEAATVRPIVTPMTPATAPQAGVLQRAVAGGPPGEAKTSVGPATAPVVDDGPRTAPVVDDGPHTALTSFTAQAEIPGVASPSEFSVPVAVQRSPSHIDFFPIAPRARAAIAPTELGSPGTPSAFETPILRPDIPIAQRALRSVTPASSAATTTPPQPTLTTAAASVQRHAAPEGRNADPVLPVAALPVVQRATDAVSDNLSGSFNTATTAPSAASTTAQRLVDAPTSPGRVVLLPPIRTATREPADQPREVLADSSRPMSLQRMFGDFAKTTDDPEPTRPAVHDEHAAVQTTRFDAPTAQREIESEQDPVASAQSAPEPSSPAQGAPAPAPAGAANAPANVDELVGRLYEPLAARLRAELWLDRERAGNLMGLH
jgi:hypothetical protein